MQTTAAILFVFVVACSMVGALPRDCFIYKECDDLDGLCCPNHEGVMLECCILGAVRLESQHLMDVAESAKGNASSLARESKDAARKAEEAELAAEAAKEKQQKLNEDVEKEEEAELAAEAAKEKQQKLNE